MRQCQQICITENCAFTLHSNTHYNTRIIWLGMLMFKVAFSLFSNINQSVCRALDWVLISQSDFDWVLSCHWEFPIHKKIIPMSTCPICSNATHLLPLSIERKVALSRLEYDFLHRCSYFAENICCLSKGLATKSHFSPLAVLQKMLQLFIDFFIRSLIRR